MSKDDWYFGKYMGKVAKGSWEVTKQVGVTMKEHPVAASVGAVGGFMVGGPIGAAAGAAAGAGVAKGVKAETDKD